MVRGAFPGKSPSPSSVQPVERHRAAGHDAMLGRGRDAGAVELLLDHVGRAGEEPVAVRVVGRPQDLVRPYIVGEVLQAALDWLERDPALPLEDVAGTRLQPAVVKALVVEMAVHAVDPRRDPAAAPLAEPDAQL